MVVCDDFKQIHYLNLGWLGSVHDQRIYQNSSLNKKPNLYFALREYILGDSAFTNTPTVVPAYKEIGGQVMLTAGQTFSNDLLSSARCQVETTIGIWKGRFPFLWQLSFWLACNFVSY
jgi:hypothetical protein